MAQKIVFMIDTSHLLRYIDRQRGKSPPRGMEAWHRYCRYLLVDAKAMLRFAFLSRRNYSSRTGLMFF